MIVRTSRILGWAGIKVGIFHGNGLPSPYGARFEPVGGEIMHALIGKEQN